MTIAAAMTAAIAIVAGTVATDGRTEFTNRFPQRGQPATPAAPPGRGCCCLPPFPKPLQPCPAARIVPAMTEKITKKAAVAGAAIGSAAVAAALLYAGKKRRKLAARQPGAIPSGEKPETD